MQGHARPDLPGDAPVAALGEAGVLVVDLHGTATLGERLPPTVSFAMLADFHRRVREVVVERGGRIGAVAGDQAMAFFVSGPSEPPSVAVCRAALALQKELLLLRVESRRRGRPVPFARVGIASGEVAIGSWGIPEVAGLTAVGDAVNVASRLESLAKTYGVGIVADDRTAFEAGPDFVTRPLDWVVLVGRRHPTLIVELVAEAGRESWWQREFAERCGRAFLAYARRDWHEALREAEALLEIRPHDVPLRLLGDRCRRFAAQPPPPDWDGTLPLTSKDAPPEAI